MFASVLRRGGLFAACAPSRDNDPELADLVPRRGGSFDAEDAAAIVGEHFDQVQVERWNLPDAITLPTIAAVEEYLFGRRVEPERCGEEARRLGAPLSITKRGCLVWARKE